MAGQHLHHGAANTPNCEWEGGMERGSGRGEAGEEEEECRGLECQPDSDGTMHTPGTHDNTVKSIS